MALQCQMSTCNRPATHGDWCWGHRPVGMRAWKRKRTTTSKRIEDLKKDNQQLEEENARLDRILRVIGKSDEDEE